MSLKGLSGAELLDAYEQKRIREPRYSYKEPRVSSIGGCERQQVNVMRGKITPRPFPIYYDLIGNGVELRLVEIYRELFGDDAVLHKCAVETCVEGVFCHPDIILADWYGPGMDHAIQLKTCSKKWLDYSSAPKGGAYQQATLEWKFLRDRPFYTHTTKLGEVVERRAFISGYEILYVSRDISSLQWKSFPFEYNQRLAEELEGKFKRIAATGMKRNSRRDPEYLLDTNKLSRAGIECQGCEMTNVCWPKEPKTKSESINPSEASISEADFN